MKALTFTIAAALAFAAVPAQAADLDTRVLASHACHNVKSGIPVDRSISIAIRGGKGFVKPLRLAGATNNEIRRMVKQAMQGKCLASRRPASRFLQELNTAQQRPELSKKELAALRRQELIAARDACAVHLSALPYSERLQGVMSAPVCQIKNT